MDGTITRLTIGELARETGLSVRTIRFYADRGLVPPVERTESGYRLFDAEAVVRLELVRTLRELGVDLPAIARVLAREASVADVAATHARAVEAQLRVLRLRLAVLRAVRDRGSDPEEMKAMHDLARATAEERRHIVEDFLNEAFDGLDIEPGFAERMRSGLPELPDDPTPEQTDAWIELARLVRDPGFRERIRAMSERHSQARAAGEEPGGGFSPETAQVVAQLAGQALAEGIDPASEAARPVVDEVAGAFARAAGRDDDAAFRAELEANVASGTDARAERYWQLLAIINGWPPVPTTVPAWEWLIAALRAHRA